MPTANNSTLTIQNMAKQLFINETTSARYLQRAVLCATGHQPAQQMIDENLSIVIQYYIFSLQLGKKYNTLINYSDAPGAIENIPYYWGGASCYTNLQSGFASFYNLCFGSIIHTELLTLISTLQKIRDELTHRDLQKVYEILQQLDTNVFQKVSYFITDLNESLLRKVFVPKIRSNIENEYLEIPSPVKSFLLNANNLSSIYHDANHALKFTFMMERSHRYTAVKFLNTKTLMKLPDMAAILKSSAINFKLVQGNRNTSFQSFHTQLLYSAAAYLHPQHGEFQSMLQMELPDYLRDMIITKEFYHTIMHTLPLPDCTQQKNCFSVLTSPHNIAELHNGFDQLAHGGTLNPLNFITSLELGSTDDATKSYDGFYFVPVVSFIALVALLARFINSHCHRPASHQPANDVISSEKKPLISLSHTLWRKPEGSTIDIKVDEQEHRLKHC